ncbi:hypothetical protein HUU61_05810 [Rhodopseudomonas palustris]|nr:hypothetical protein [Rhodopseudomonas palustris]
MRLRVARSLRERDEKGGRNAGLVVLLLNEARGLDAGARRAVFVDRDHARGDLSADQPPFSIDSSVVVAL